MQFVRPMMVGGRDRLRCAGETSGESREACKQAVSAPALTRRGAARCLVAGASACTACISGTYNGSTGEGCCDVAFKVNTLACLWTAVCGTVI